MNNLIEKLNSSKLEMFSKEKSKLKLLMFYLRFRLTQIKNKLWHLTKIFLTTVQN